MADGVVATWLGIQDSSDMRQAHGAGPVFSTCQHCAHLVETTSQPRPSEHARHHQPITIFRCTNVPGVPWSVSFPSCGLFQRRAR